MTNKVEEMRLILERTFLMPVSESDAALVLERAEKLTNTERGLTTDAPEMTVGDLTPSTDSDLSEPCPVCNGKKKAYAWFKWINCWACYGQGRVTPNRLKELTPSPTPSFR